MQLLETAGISTLLSELGELSFFTLQWSEHFRELSVPTLFLAKWIKFNLPSLPTALTFCAEVNTFCMSFRGDLRADSETAGKSPLGTAQMKFCYSNKKRWSWCLVLPLLLLYAKTVRWWIILGSRSGSFIYSSILLQIWNKIWTVGMTIRSNGGRLFWL